MNFTLAALLVCSASTLAQQSVVVEELASERPGKIVEANGVLPVSAARLCDAILSFEHYPEFMPNVESAEIVEERTDDYLADMNLALPLGKKKRYRLRMHHTIENRVMRIAWQQVPRPQVAAAETINDTSGYWLLRPLNAHSTHVTYHVYIDPGPVPFGLGWIVDLLSTQSVPKAVESLQQFAGKRGAADAAPRANCKLPPAAGVSDD